MQKRLLRSLATDTHEQMSFDSTMSALGGARYGQSMLARAWLDRIIVPACTDYIDDFIQASPAQAMVQTIVKNNNKKNRATSKRMNENELGERKPPFYVSLLSILRHCARYCSLIYIL